jgi:hypothetical protein
LVGVPVGVSDDDATNARVAAAAGVVALTMSAVVVAVGVGGAMAPAVDDERPERNDDTSASAPRRVGSLVSAANDSGHNAMLLSCKSITRRCSIVRSSYSGDSDSALTPSDHSSVERHSACSAESELGSDRKQIVAQLERRQILQTAERVGQRAEPIVRQLQLDQIGELANLGRQSGDAVVSADTATSTTASRAHDRRQTCESGCASS